MENRSAESAVGGGGILKALHAGCDIKCENVAAELEDDACRKNCL